MSENEALHEIIKLKTGQFGMLEFGAVEGIPFVILMKTTLRYHDPARDKDDKNDKEKANVVLVYNEQSDIWACVGRVEPYSVAVDYEAVKKMCLETMKG